MKSECSMYVASHDDIQDRQLSGTREEVYYWMMIYKIDNSQGQERKYILLKDDDIQDRQLLGTREEIYIIERWWYTR